MKETLTQEQFNQMFGVEAVDGGELLPAPFSHFSLVLMAQIFDRYGKDAADLGTMLLGVAVAAGANPDKLITAAGACDGIEKIRGAWPL